MPPGKFVTTRSRDPLASLPGLSAPPAPPGVPLMQLALCMRMTYRKKTCQSVGSGGSSATFPINKARLAQTVQ